jgi:hypothetical protein
VPPNDIFLIGSVAPTLAEFQKLSPDVQAVAFLRRLSFVFPPPKTFHRGNLSLIAYGKPDPQGLCSGWPREDISSGLQYLLKTPWHLLERDGYIAGAVAGHEFFEITDEGWVVAKKQLP